MLRIIFLLTLISFNGTLIAQPSIHLLPESPYITTQGSVQYIEFDFIIEGIGSGKYELEKIELKVYDKNDFVQVRKKMDDDGMVSSFNAFPKTRVKGKKQISLYNPFYFFEHSVQLHRLEFNFTFQKGKNKITISKLVFPIHYKQITDLVVPINGKVIIDSGYDHYAHHRRLNTTHWGMKLLKISKNITRYALDLAPCDENGEISYGDGKTLEDYSGFSQSVFAPASGKIIELASGFPDNEIGKGPPYGFFKFIKNPKLASGNYIVIDHGYGEVSLLAHLKNGSIDVNLGQEVKKGEFLAEIGNSGDSTYPHLHYQLENEHTENAETYPPQFSQIQILNGKKVNGLTYCNTGDLIESH